MGVFLPETPSQTVIRAAYVGGLGAGSQLDGWFSLDNDYRQLVGLAPEALNVLARKYPQYAAVFVSHANEVRTGLERYFATAGQGPVEQLGRQETGNMLSGASVREQKQEKPYVEVKSKSGFLPGRENDIEVDDAGTYVHEQKMNQALENALCAAKSEEDRNRIRDTFYLNLQKKEEA